MLFKVSALRFRIHYRIVVCRLFLITVHFCSQPMIQGQGRALKGGRGAINPDTGRENWDIQADGP